MRHDNLARIILALVLLGSNGLARAADTCTAHSVDEVGNCPAMHHDRHVQRVVQREIQGEPAPEPESPPFDSNLLATQISGDFSVGQVARVRSGMTGDWVLAIKPGVLNKDGELIGAQPDAGSVQLALLRWQPAPATGSGENGEGQRPVVQLRAMFDASDVLAQAANFEGPACVNPDQSAASGDYDLTGDYRWLSLGAGHRVLAASLDHEEGYAGGSGSFQAMLLLDVQGEHLVPIACYAVDNFQMFGGEWNPDGTREHPQAHSAWQLHVHPRPGASWPDLVLRPLTHATAGARLIWDAAHKHYVEAPSVGAKHARSSS